MKTYLRLGGLILCLDSERSLRATEFTSPFCVEPQEADITIHYHWDWQNAQLPHTVPVGGDLLQTYYRELDDRYCEFCGNGLYAVSCTYYKQDFSEMTCAINEATYRAIQDTEAQLLRMLPMREIFLHFGVLFLHASQIVYRGRGVLFAAPSGTGKTTQARLWQTCRGAEIICNDRTLIRKVEGVWRTYGYPMDGSEPVHSSAMNTLGAVVLLEQGKTNEVRRLSPGKAASLLMGQMVIDSWNTEARASAMELLLTMIEEIPVYILTCTPDERAVTALEEKLTEERVFPLRKVTVKGNGV